jgi:DNA-binding transcriptional regulator YhcF (GntR family)
MAFPHKSQKIAETIASWFEEKRYRPGDRFPSDQELARQFGVNHVTVRTALKRFVDQGWLERKVGAGTVVRDPKSRAEAEARGGNPAVAIAIPDATHSFFSELLRSVEGALHGTGRPLMLGHTWELAQREEQVVSAWVAQGVRRMVLTPPVSEGRFYNRLREQGRAAGVRGPAGGVGGRAQHRQPRRGGDGPGGALPGGAGAPAAATPGGAGEHLDRAPAPRELRSLRARGRAARVVPGGDHRRLLHRGRLRGDDPPAAVGPAARRGGGANDPVAVGAVRALHERGLRVPEDVLVTGYGDTDIGRNFGLTTVRQFPDRMGAEAIRLILGPDPLSARDSIELMPELVVRTPAPSTTRLIRAAT